MIAETIEFRERQSINWLFIFVILSIVYGGALIGIAIAPVALFFLFKWSNEEKFFEVFGALIIICILSDSRSTSLGFSQALKAAYIVLLVILNYRMIRSLGEDRIDYLKFVFPFILITLLALVQSEIFFTSLQKSISYLLVIASVPNILYLGFKNEGPKIFSKINYLFFGVVIFGNLSVYLPIPLINPFSGDRFAGVFGNPNGIGSFALMSLMLLHYTRRYYSEVINRNFYIFFNILLAYNILISGSRTALIAGLAFLFFLYPLKYLRQLAFIAVASLLIFRDYIIDAIVIYANNIGLEDVLRTETLETGSGRTIAIDFAWKYIQEFFWLGRGMGFADYLFGTNFRLLSAMGHQGSVHNTYFLIWLDAGLVGLVVFFLGYLVVFRNLIKLDSSSWALVVVVFITTLTEVWIAGSLTPWMLAFLVIYSLIKIKNEKTSGSIR